MATIVSFVSEKGGVGKTTSCYHVAVALSYYHKKRVLVIDADYQRGGISGRFFPELIEEFESGAASGTTLYHKFQQLYSAGDRTPDVDVRNWSFASARVDVVPADPRLSTVSTDKLPSTNNIRQNNALLLEHLRLLSFVIEPLRDDYDYVLIDSHPEVSDVLRSIIYASDYCVSPVKLDRQSSIGVATVIGEIRNVNADVEMIMNNMPDVVYNDTKFSGSMGMMAREWGEALKQTEQTEFNRLRRTGGVFENYVTEGDGLRQAAAARQPVFFISGANADKQSDQFKALTEEFVAKCP